MNQIQLDEFTRPTSYALGLQLNSQQGKENQKSDCYDKIEFISNQSHLFSSLFDQVPRNPKPIIDRLYLSTNEGGKENVIKIISETPMLEGKNVIIGVSGAYTLNIASAIGTAQKLNKIKKLAKMYLIMFDISLNTERFWKEMSNILKESATKEEALEKVISLTKEKGGMWDNFNPDENSDYGRYNATLCRERLQQEVKSGESFLSSDEKFKRIKNIFLKDRFIFLNIDLTHNESFKALGTVLKTNKLQTVALYLSNIIGNTSKRSLIPASVNYVANDATKLIGPGLKKGKDMQYMQHVITWHPKCLEHVLDA